MRNNISLIMTVLQTLIEHKCIANNEVINVLISENLPVETRRKSHTKYVGLPIYQRQFPH